MGSEGSQKRGGSVDYAGLLETLYRVDMGRTEWLAAVAESVQPLLDRNHLGILGSFYEWRAPFFISPEAILERGVTDRLWGYFAEANLTMPRSYVAAFICSPCTVFQTSVHPSWVEIPVVLGGMRSIGVHDFLGIKAIEPDGTACWLGSFHRDTERLPARTRALWSGLARHFASAHRLLRLGRLQVDAVLDSGGRVCHAEGDARGVSERNALAEAVRGNERQRKRGHRYQPDCVIEWNGSIARRWTLIDRFDQDGRKYVLAVDNPAATSFMARLTPREGEVVRRAARGGDNKTIAHELGISHATVRVLMSRAAAKVGVRTRSALLEKVRSAGAAPDRAVGSGCQVQASSLRVERRSVDG